LKVTEFGLFHPLVGKKYHSLDIKIVTLDRKNDADFNDIIFINKIITFHFSMCPPSQIWRFLSLFWLQKTEIGGK